GLIGSLAKEYPKWQVRLVDLPALPELSQASSEDAWPMEELLALPAHASGQARAWRDGQWFEQRLLACEAPQSKPTSGDQSSAYRAGGVYVILGGAGGLGEAFSEYLINRYQAQVVWIGRRELEDTIAAKQHKLSALGCMPHY